MPTTSELTDWLDRYKIAWEQLDAEAAAALFTPEARYHETPYSDPFLGADGVRDYWSRVTADQADVIFTHEVLGVTGETGVATWNAKLTSVSSGARVELDGVFLLQFASDGRCELLREWWHVR
jgi:hypothetical protein